MRGGESQERAEESARRRNLSTEEGWGREAVLPKSVHTTSTTVRRLDHNELMNEGYEMGSAI